MWIEVGGSCGKKEKKRGLGEEEEGKPRHLRECGAGGAVLALNSCPFVGLGFRRRWASNSNLPPFILPKGQGEPGVKEGQSR